MILFTIKRVSRSLVPNPATPNSGNLIYPRIRSYSSVLTFDEFNLKKKFFENIKIYSNNSVKDPVDDYQTLKLFNKLDEFLRKKDKENAIDCVR